MKSFQAAVFILITVCVLTCNRRDLNMFNPYTYFPEEIKKEEESPAIVLKNDSPENVLENLKTAYNRRRTDIYESLITDDYKFYMSPSFYGAIQQGKVSPPDNAYWESEMDNDTLKYYKTHEQELASIRRMFDPVKGAKDIELIFRSSLYMDISSDTVIYKIFNIQLTVTLRDDPTPLVAEDNPFLESTKATLVKGSDGLWKISVWIDNTFGSHDEL
jgi:hypothetical protein